MAVKEKTNKRKTLLWIGLGILAGGILSFGGLLAFGLITLARDLLFLSLFADTLLVGGVLGAKAVDAITDKVASNKKETKKERLTRSEELTKEKNNVEELLALDDKQVSRNELENSAVEWTFGEQPKDKMTKGGR